MNSGSHNKRTEKKIVIVQEYTAVELQDRLLLSRQL